MTEPMPADAAATAALGPPGITRFIVLCAPRTGSNMLVSALNSHPRVVCFREIFNYTFTDIDYNVAGYRRDDPADIDLRYRDPASFLRTRVFAHDPSATDAAGFKFMYEHFWGFPGLLEALTADTSLRVIHLQRYNGVRAFLSYKLAETTGEWIRMREPTGLAAVRDRAMRGIRHPLKAANAVRRGLMTRSGSARGEGAAATGAIRLDPDECVGYIKMRDEQIAHFDGLFAGHALLTVQYESILHDRDSTLRQVQEFLGVTPQHLVEDVERQNIAPMRELIANYDELSRALTRSPYAKFLEQETQRPEVEPRVHGGLA